MAVVEQIIGWYEGQQDEYEEDDGDGLVGLRLLHGTTVIAQGVISREFLEELGVDAVVITVELPLMEGKSCHCTLVAHVEDDLIVSLDAVVEPLDLRCLQREVAHGAQQIMVAWMLGTMVLVEVIATGVCEEQCALVGAVDIREIGAVGIGAGLCKRIGGKSGKWSVKRGE